MFFFFFFTSLLNRCGKGYLVVTELRKKTAIFSYVYCISQIYKGCRSIREMRFN